MISTQLWTIVAGFIGSFLFVFILTAIANLGRLVFYISIVVLYYKH